MHRRPRSAPTASGRSRANPCREAGSACTHATPVGIAPSWPLCLPLSAAERPSKNPRLGVDRSSIANLLYGWCLLKAPVRLFISPARGVDAPDAVRRGRRRPAAGKLGTTSYPFLAAFVELVPSSCVPDPALVALRVGRVRHRPDPEGQAQWKTDPVKVADGRHKALVQLERARRNQPAA